MTRNSDGTGRNSGKQRGPGKPFSAGQSGNPKGRPKKGTSLAELCRMHREDAVALLVACMQDEAARWSDRLDAIKTLLAYGDGKPSTYVEAAEDEDAPRTLRIVLADQADFTAAKSEAKAAESDD